MKSFTFFILIYFSLISFALNEDVIDDVEVLKNRVWEGYETKVGAHYYAYSPYITGYSKVTSYIILPDKVNTNNGARNAYISFGVLGLYGSIDTGIMNAGKGRGWCPCKYDAKKDEFIAYQNYYGPADTVIVGLTVEVLSQRIVIFSVSFRDKNLKILKSFNVKFDASHILVYENNRVKNRFYRFASLVPVQQDDQNDKTYMVGGKFTGLTIVRNGIGYPWGITLDDIDVAWKVSTKRIPFIYDESNDKFDIIHNKDGKMPGFIN